MKNKTSFICLILAFLIVITFVMIILFKSEPNTNKIIIKAISEDQEATGDKVIAYKIDKLNSNEYVIYTATIINDKGEMIDYIIRFDNKEIVYCEEIK